MQLHLANVDYLLITGILILRVPECLHDSVADRTTTDRYT